VTVRHKLTTSLKDLNLCLPTATVSVAPMQLPNYHSHYTHILFHLTRLPSKTP
jgi:hypothetical protein